MNRMSTAAPERPAGTGDLARVLAGSERHAVGTVWRGRGRQEVPVVFNEVAASDRRFLAARPSKPRNGPVVAALSSATGVLGGAFVLAMAGLTASTLLPTGLLGADWGVLGTLVNADWGTQGAVLAGALFGSSAVTGCTAERIERGRRSHVEEAWDEYEERLDALSHTGEQRSVGVLTDESGGDEVRFLSESSAVFLAACDDLETQGVGTSDLRAEFSAAVSRFIDGRAAYRWYAASSARTGAALTGTEPGSEDPDVHQLRLLHARYCSDRDRSQAAGESARAAVRSLLDHARSLLADVRARVDAARLVGEEGPPRPSGGF